MKNLTLVVVGVFLMAGLAFADPTDAVSCGGPVTITSSTVYHCDGLTLSNFLFNNADGGVVPGQFIVGGSFDPDVSAVFISFNPQLGPTGNTTDIHMFFTVSGGINGIDLTVGGTNASINEVACNTAFITTQGFPGYALCNSSANGGTQLASIARQSGQPAAIGNFALTSPVYIFKDITIGAGGELSNFQQSYHTVVPEPASMVLLGSGLLGLAGLARRKIRK